MFVRRYSTEWGFMQKGSKSRRFNGVVAAIITALFLAHAAMGSLSALTGFQSPLSIIVWLGVVLVVVHVIASVVTSYEQLSDAERPPSSRKKRHLALKWVTGGLLGVVAVAHIVFPKSTMAATALVVVLAIVLAVHLCVGGKSLLKDIGLDVRYKMAYRVVVCVIAGAAVVALLIGATGVFGGFNA